MIGAFDKHTIIELSGDVIKEIVQKGVGDMMGGALIETEARTILNQGISQGVSVANRKTAFRMLKKGKLTVPEIAEYTELSVEEVELLAEVQTV